MTHVATAASLLLGGIGAAWGQAAAPAPAGAASAAAPAAAASQPASPEVTTVVVTGIRHSLETSLDLKRDSQGIVDGIVAEDIGKFPDTNLAEAMQRISGVSIDRQFGEGSRVTVRGVGPDFNLVLLNGRQMPTASIQATTASNSRAFDFSNLAAESIAALEVYKTSRASTPTGGLGATINIKTTRPLDQPGQHGSIGTKLIYDQSNTKLPDSIQGEQATPEFSGLYSNTFNHDTIGVALSGSYQVRDSGYNEAGVPGGWRTFKGSDNAWGTIPQNGSPGSERITNRPGPDDTYSVPQNLLYAVNGVHRERTNGQLTLQYAPASDITTTLDYTYSEEKLRFMRNELSAWFNFGPSTSTWTNGPVAAPTYYSEIINPPTSDIAMAGGLFASKNTNASTGLNVLWKPTDRLRFEFDAHSSSAESAPDSPYGSNATLGTAQFNRGTTSVDFTHALPVLNIDSTGLDPSLMQVTGSSFRNSFERMEIQQEQGKGQWKLDGGSKLDFGVGLTDVKNRSAYGFTQRDTWGGATNAGDYPDDLWHADNMAHYFGGVQGSNDPRLTGGFYTWDFNKVRTIAAQVSGDPSLYVAPTQYSVDRRTEEKSRNGYLQYSTDWEWGVPMALAAGVRYEATDVTSSALVPSATGVNMVGDNEFSVLFGAPTFTSLKGKYAYWLPSIDYDVDLTAKLKGRISFGETIGRPSWQDIQGGQTLDQLARVDGGTGSQGNPALKPLKSNNFDFSLEDYYAKSSYVAVGYFSKNISNYVGKGSVQGTPFNLHTPVGGAWWNEALASGCASTDGGCIRNYIFAHHAGEGGVRMENNQIIIPGQPGDPIMPFTIGVPANTTSARLYGVEFNVQHMFGASGFGVSANYTYVNSGLKYDNAKIGPQFALVGLSDTANLVGFYENDWYEARLAWNWRGQFLNSLTDGTGGDNPVYTEPYRQIDFSTSWKPTKNLSFSFEAINLTNSYQRLHGRSKDEVIDVVTTGRRFGLGARYNF